MLSVMTVYRNKKRGIVASDVRGKRLGKSICVGSKRVLVGFGVAAGLTLSLYGQASAEDCASLTASFDEALKMKDVDAAKAAEQKIARDAICSAKTVDAQRRRAGVEVGLAEALKEAPAKQGEREGLLISADKPGVNWTAAYALGEFRFGQRRFADATEQFEKAIEIVKNPSFTPKSPGEKTIKDLLARASQAKALAANEEGNKVAAYVPSGKDHRGNIGGSLSDTVRDIRPTSVPLPINFETNEARFTPIGQKAAEELAQALLEQHPDEITLVGHTDERGEDGYNMGLSKARVEAVAGYVDRYLKQHNAKARIRLEWFGKRRPLEIDDTTGMTQQDVWALNRRVELKR